MMISRYSFFVKLRFLIVVIFNFSFCLFASSAFSSENLKDSLNHFGEPNYVKVFDDYRNQKFSPMFDLGAWHGFLLPEQPKNYGSFTGPMVIAQEYGVYLSRNLEKLILKDQISGKVYDFSSAKSEIYSTSGTLFQQFEFNDLIVSLKLTFASNRSALVITQILNKTESSKSLLLTLKGGLLNDWDEKSTVEQQMPQWSRELSSSDKEIVIDFGKVRSKWHLMMSGHEQYVISRSIKTESTTTKYEYVSQSNIQVEPNETFEYSTLHSYYHTKDERLAEKQYKTKWLSSSQLVFEDSKSRWQDYTAKLKDNLTSTKSKKVAIKALETLISNWRSSAGALLFDGVSPSVTARWFNGFWAWDSWKHAYALASIKP